MLQKQFGLICCLHSIDGQNAYIKYLFLLDSINWVKPFCVNSIDGGEKNGWKCRWENRRKKHHENITFNETQSTTFCANRFRFPTFLNIDSFVDSSQYQFNCSIPSTLSLVWIYIERDAMISFSLTQRTTHRNTILEWSPNHK